MSGMLNFTKYRIFKPVHFRSRTWPDNVITKAPIWSSSDLRDGNQAIPSPMDERAKLEFFKLLLKIGFKDIEAGYPVASSADYNSIRMLIEGGHIQDGVSISALTPVVDEHIAKTVECLRGAKEATVHFYIATSPLFREKVLKMTKKEVLDRAVGGARLIKKLTDAAPETKWTMEFSPETFSQTELKFSRDICNAVLCEWDATPSRKAIINLPATVEVCTPNIFADMVEWMNRSLIRRNSVILSVHPHNDRGSAISAAEFAVMAGADRVEGCLFGNGERTGNVDLVTLAMNLYSQGVNPMLDFSNMDEIVKTVEKFTGIPVHPRQPYAGRYAFTAFSGGHQDGIRKGLASQKKVKNKHWLVPYLPIDPEDVGRTYEELIRINGQSGKAGIASAVEGIFGLELPRELQVEFGKTVQAYADNKGGEVNADILRLLFEKEYLTPCEKFRYVGHQLCSRHRDAPQGIKIDLKVEGKSVSVYGEGNGPIDAAVKAFNFPLDVVSYGEHSIGKGSGAKAASYVHLSLNGSGKECHGVGIHENSTTASVMAVVGGIGRAIKQGKIEVTENFGKTERPKPLSKGFGAGAYEKPKI